MIKGCFYWLIVIAIIFSGCVASVQTYDLSLEYATSLHYEGSKAGDDLQEGDGNENLAGVPVLSFYNGDLKRGAIWWAGKGMVLEKGEEYVITAFNIGPESTPFGATFPPVDLIKEPVMLKVRVRIESDLSDSLRLYLQVDDASGYQANGKRPSYVINKAQEYKDYYFDLRDIYVQSEPKKHSVNGAMINSLKFFINPGQSGFTGQLFIKEIKVVSVKSLENK